MRIALPIAGRPGPEDSAEQCAIAATRKNKSGPVRGESQSYMGRTSLAKESKHKDFSIQSSRQGLGPGRRSAAARGGRGTTAPRAAAT